jgi:glycosyltransferase involved in cell wall biosynthesis
VSERPLRLAVLSAWDPFDRRHTSGTIFYMCQALAARGHTLVPLGPVHPLAEHVGRWRNRASRALLRKRWPFAHGEPLARAYARAFAPRLRAAGPVDAVFAPFAAAELSALDVSAPVLYASDAVIPIAQDYNPAFSDFSPAYAREAREVERRAIARAAIVTFPSAWAADGARAAYPVAPERIRIVPYGANLDTVPSEATVREAKRVASSRILFIGVRWEEKGGPLLVRALDALRARGADATLTVVGCRPSSGDLRPWMTVIPRIDKRVPGEQAQLVALLADARLLVVPTRSDAYGIVFAEAAACGTPSITTDTGGVSAAVIEGVTGHLLPISAGPDLYAAAIDALLTDTARYTALSTSARAHHERTQSWDAWGRAMDAALQAMVAPAA